MRKSLGKKRAVCGGDPQAKGRTRAPHSLNDEKARSSAERPCGEVQKLNPSKMPGHEGVNPQPARGSPHRVTPPRGGTSSAPGRPLVEPSGGPLVKTRDAANTKQNQQQPTTRKRRRKPPQLATVPNTASERPKEKEKRGSKNGTPEKHQTEATTSETRRDKLNKSGKERQKYKKQQPQQKRARECVCVSC